MFRYIHVYPRLALFKTFALCYLCLFYFLIAKFYCHLQMEMNEFTKHIFFIKNIHCGFKFHNFTGNMKIKCKKKMSLSRFQNRMRISRFHSVYTAGRPELAPLIPPRWWSKRTTIGCISEVECGVPLCCQEHDFSSLVLLFSQ